MHGRARNLWYSLTETQKMSSSWEARTTFKSCSMTAKYDSGPVKMNATQENGNVKETGNVNMRKAYTSNVDTTIVVHDLLPTHTSYTNLYTISETQITQVFIGYPLYSIVDLHTHNS